jgi:hypothetical protein
VTFIDRTHASSPLTSSTAIALWTSARRSTGRARASARRAGSTRGRARRPARGEQRALRSCTLGLRYRARAGPRVNQRPKRAIQRHR